MRAVERLPEMSLIFYPDETLGGDQAVYVPVEPADPFTEAIRTGLEIGAEIVFADPGRRRAPAPERRLSRPVRHPAYRARALRGGLSRLPAAALAKRSRGTPPGIAWKLQGADPHGDACSWWFRSTCSTPCWTPWRSRRRSPLARTRREDVELLNPHPGIAGRDRRRVSRSSSGATRATGRP